MPKMTCMVCIYSWVTTWGVAINPLYSDQHHGVVYVPLWYTPPLEQIEIELLGGGNTKKNQCPFYCVLAHGWGANNRWFFYCLLEVMTCLPVLVLPCHWHPFDRALVISPHGCRGEYFPLLEDLLGVLLWMGHLLGCWNAPLTPWIVWNDAMI